MKKRSFYKDISRTLRNNLSRFIAIVVMVALGSGVFAGFAAGCLNVFRSANRFYTTQNMYDIKIVSTLGLTGDDLAAVTGIQGVRAAFGSCSLDVEAKNNDGKPVLANLSVLDPEGMNEPYVIEGTVPSKAGQLAVNSKFIDDTGLKIGDKINLTEAVASEKAKAADSNAGISAANDTAADTTADAAGKSDNAATNGSTADANEDEETDLEITVDSASSGPELVVKEYEITAVILSPLDIANKEGSIASISFSADSGDYLLYATSDCIRSDIYTAIYLTVDGTIGLDSYSDKYQSITHNKMTEIESAIQNDRETARYEEVVAEANSKIDEAETLIADKMAEAEQKLNEAQKEIDDGWVKVKDGWAEVSANALKLDDGEQKLSDAQKDAEKKLSVSQAEIDDKRKALAEGEAKLNLEEENARKQFAAYEQQLTQKKDELVIQKSEAEKQLESTVTGLPEAAQQIWKAEATQQIWEDMIADGINAAPYLTAVKQGEKPTADQDEGYHSAMTKLQTDSQVLAGAFISAGTYVTEDQMKEFSTLAVTFGTLSYNEARIDESSSALAKQKAEALAKITSASQEIADGKSKLSAGQKKLNEGRTDAEIQFADKKKELAEGRQKLDDARAELLKSEEKLTDGQEELDRNKQDYESSIATAKRKLEDAKADIADITMTKWYIWDRSENDGFEGLHNDVTFIQQITKAFPFIFFLVAILISLTTMTRMVEEDRGLIGTYKSLGYSKFQISLKYIFYSTLACILGGILGAVVGFYILPKIIEIIFSTLYVLPEFRLSFYANYGLGGFGLFLMGIVGATVISCGEMLHKRPAELMRPKAPKAGSRILLERVPFLWKRLSFLNKVTCRNLFRYKKRAIMTIVGILGCTMLIVFAFGIRDTVGGLMGDQFHKITIYDAIVVTDDLSTEEMNALAEEWNDSTMVDSELPLETTTLTLNNAKNNMDITVMVMPDGADLGAYVILKDTETHKAISLTEGGIVVTQNAARQLGINRGDTVSLQNDDHEEYDFPVAAVTTNYAGNFVYLSENSYQKAFGDYKENSFLLNLSDQADAQNWLNTRKDDDRILNVSNNQEVVDSFQDVNRIINMIVYLLIGMSAVLAFAVLFTLANINISERERELATVKVLGFLPKEVYSYVNKETLILTFLGILAGLPAGYEITYLILSNVSIANVAFKVRVSGAAYLIATVLTLIFTLIVNHITNKALHKINMVGALKSVE